MPYSSRQGIPVAADEFNDPLAGSPSSRHRKPMMNPGHHPDSVGGLMRSTDSSRELRMFLQLLGRFQACFRRGFRSQEKTLSKAASPHQHHLLV